MKFTAYFFVFLCLLASLAHAQNYPSEFSPDKKTDARTKLDTAVLADFNVKDASLWDAFSSIGKRAKATLPRSALPEFVLKSSTHNHTPEPKITLHMQNTKVSALIDAVALQADYAWFCTEDSIVMIPKSEVSQKLIDEYSPRPLAPPPPAPLCEVQLESKQVTSTGVTLNWTINASGVSREALAPNLVFRILAKNKMGNMVPKTIKFKSQSFEDTGTPGMYRYVMVLESVPPDITTFDLQAKYKGKEVFHDTVALDVPEGAKL
ncbi:MAG: hypothetical protein ABI443_11595 [Chthoniobacterales bacterium]